MSGGCRAGLYRLCEALVDVPTAAETGAETEPSVEEELPTPTTAEADQAEPPAERLETPAPPLVEPEQSGPPASGETPSRVHQTTASPEPKARPSPLAPVLQLTPSERSVAAEVLKCKPQLVDQMLEVWVQFKGVRRRCLSALEHEGETEHTAAVLVVGDRVLEPREENFHVDLSDPTNSSSGDGRGLGTLVDDELCEGPNLVTNASFEQRPDGGEQGAVAEIFQDIDLTAYAAAIDTGGQLFTVSARLQTFDTTPSDLGRVRVEYRDASNTVVLDTFDSGPLNSPLTWSEISDARLVPVGTGWVRMRLEAHRAAGVDGDPAGVLFDALALRSQRTATLTVDNISTSEGNAGTTEAEFTVRLSWPFHREVSASHQTVDGTAPIAAIRGAKAIGTTIFSTRTST